MSDETAATKQNEADNNQETQKGNIDWEDPSVPVGNSPRLPRWPMAISAMLWVLWIGFLIFVLSSANPTHFH